MGGDSENRNMAERYAAALESSHLEMNLERRTAIDVVIAAGWSGDVLGAALLRLRAEYASSSKLDPTTGALRPTLQLLFRYAERRAARMRYMARERTIRTIAASTLALWLSPNCRTCHGTGRVGVFGSPMAICNHCGGAGRRSPRLGKNDRAHDFGRDLHDHMTAKVDRVSRVMARYLK